MEAGTIPPNWENLIKYSSKMATAQDVDLSDTWLQGQSKKEASETLSDPLYILTYHHKHQKTNTSGSASAIKDIHISVSEGEKSYEAISSTSQPMNQSADNSFANFRSKSNNERAGVKIYTFNSNLYSNPSSQNFDRQYLIMPTMLNPHYNGLRRSTRLRELQEK